MPSTTRRRLGAAFAVLTLAAAAAVLVSPSAGAAVTSCRVTNATQGTWFATWSGAALTDALAAAAPGDRLNVSGTCRGAYSVAVDVTIAGRSDGTTTLRGTGAGPIVATVPGTTVRLHRLTMSGNTTTGLKVTEGSVVTASRIKVTGNASPLGSAGGGIQNGGDLTIYNSLIAGNSTASDGGGIFNYGLLVVSGSTINHNVAEGGGGGLFNEGVATLNHSRVRFNQAAYSGGILDVNSLTLNDTVVSDNVPDDCC